MAKVSSFTIFIWVTLTMYVILGSVFTSFALTGAPATTISLVPTPLQPYTIGYVFIECHNISLGDSVVYSNFQPNKMVQYGTWGGYNQVHFLRKDTILGLGWYGPEEIYAGDYPASPSQYVNISGGHTEGLRMYASNCVIIWEAENLSSAFAPFIVDPTTDWESSVIIAPLMSDNGTFIYGGSGPTALSNSLSNNQATILICSNEFATTQFPTGLMISSLTGVLTGFATIGAPIWISGILIAFWSIMLILGLIKLLWG